MGAIEMKEARIIRNLPYAQYGNRTLLLDLHLPGGSEGLCPVILWVCGGGWRGCSKDGAPAWLVEHGFAVASILYRVSSEAIAPANIHDCKAAVRWLRANAHTHRLDPDRIGAFGSSAGGHLVALLGLSQGVKELEGNGGNAEQSSAVQAVCDFCGPSDLTRIAIPEIRKNFALLYEVTAQYLGGPVEERRELARLVSPLSYVSRACPPMLIVHGKEDNVVPVEESLGLHEALKSAGADVTLQVLEDAGHGWEQQRTNDSVASFFRQPLKQRS
jgi:acetyl esterase/lipase